MLYTRNPDRAVGRPIVDRTIGTRARAARRRSSTSVTRAMFATRAMTTVTRASSSSSSVASDGARRPRRETTVTGPTTRRRTHRERNGFDWTTDGARERERRASEGRRACEEEENACEEEERWRYAEETDAYAYRGAWLAPRRQRTPPTAPDAAFEAELKAFREITRRMRDAGKDVDAFQPGGVEYEAILGRHVSEHVRLARRLALWRSNFVMRFEREPEYDDMPQTIRALELDWISLGFKIQAIEK